VFKLGYKYSESMKASFLDEQGKDRLLYMGCYGIGVSRVVAACIEQNHDDFGIKFPPALAPYEVAVLCLDVKGEAMAKAEEIYAWLQGQGIDALLDDRDERPGVKFKDVDLMGMPMQVVVGGKGLARGVVEVKDRRTGEKGELPVDTFQEAFTAWREMVLTGWNQR
jgi:prolyl-tRNA synthetase